MARRRKTSRQKTQQRRFKAAAKKCKGRTLKSFRQCMKKALKKRR